tara:strand:- start:111584 stop:112264 length:681 start_codon:yes stop_codon:yes gene_type:complete
LRLKDFSKLYWAFVIFHLAIIYKPDPALFYISKPLVLFSLLLFFISKIENLKNSTKWWVASALLFSLLGDVFLMQLNKDYFLAGMASFGLAHICYAIFFNRRRQGKMHIPSLIINIIFVGLLIFSLNRCIEIPSDMFVPINIYAALIGINLLSSVQFNFTNRTKNYWLPLGVLLFVLSDYLIAINRFKGLNENFEYLIFATYAAAQFLIILSVLKHFKLVDDKISV